MDLLDFLKFSLKMIIQLMKLRIFNYRYNKILKLIQLKKRNYNEKKRKKKHKNNCTIF